MVDDVNQNRASAAGCEEPMLRLRRILYSLTAVYVSNDYRLCNDSVWQSLMGCRLGSAAPSEAGLSTLVWSGAQPPWWLTDDTSAVKWHMPSEEEVWIPWLSMVDMVGWSGLED